MGELFKPDSCKLPLVKPQESCNQISILLHRTTGLDGVYLLCWFFPLTISSGSAPLLFLLLVSALLDAVQPRSCKDMPALSTNGNLLTLL